MEKETIIIIGAGAAGLMAGYVLADKMQVVILEAQNRIGGRMHSIEKNGKIIEAGAEFVHGNLPVTLGLLKDAGIAVTEVHGNMYRYKNGSLQEQTEMIEGWDTLLEKMQALEHDMTLLEFLDEHYPGTSEIRQEVINYAEGFDLADTGKVSVKSLCEEWTKEDEENYRIPSGCIALTEYLTAELIKKGGKIHTGTHVTGVKQTDKGMKAICSDALEFYADMMLITIPVNALAGTNPHAAIAFDPPIPAYQQAAADIGFGEVIKIVIEFKEPFWPEEGGFFISNQSFRTWWTMLPGEKNTLTGWAGSNAAKALQGLSEEAFLQEAYYSLSNIFNVPAAAVKDATVHYYISNPQKERFIGGGYSYSTPQSFSARVLLNTPINDRLFFAGEALYTGEHPGTVEAALVSGKDAAEKIAGA